MPVVARCFIGVVCGDFNIRFLLGSIRCLPLTAGTATGCFGGIVWFVVNTRSLSG